MIIELRDHLVRLVESRGVPRAWSTGLQLTYKSSWLRVSLHEFPDGRRELDAHITDPERPAYIMFPVFEAKWSEHSPITTIHYLEGTWIAEAMAVLPL
jgi:hypothetical protein